MVLLVEVSPITSSYEGEKYKISYSEKLSRRISKNFSAAGVWVKTKNITGMWNNNAKKQEIDYPPWMVKAAKW